MARRLPLQSGEPMIWIAAVRLLFVVIALASVAVFDVPHRGRVALVLAAAALPWAVMALAATRRNPRFAPNPLVALVDLVVLGGVQVAEPEAYAGVRFVALFFVATHAYFLGEMRGLVVAAAAVVALVPAAALLHGIPIHGGMLPYYEVLFAVSALSCGLLVGRFRTGESAARSEAAPAPGPVFPSLRSRCRGDRRSARRAPACSPGRCGRAPCWRAGPSR